MNGGFGLVLDGSQVMFLKCFNLNYPKFVVYIRDEFCLFSVYIVLSDTIINCIDTGKNPGQHHIVE
jgi:hypothetical protein